MVHPDESHLIVIAETWRPKHEGQEYAGYTRHQRCSILDWWRGVLANVIHALHGYVAAVSRLETHAHDDMSNRVRVQDAAL